MKFKVDRKVMDYLSEFDLTEREIIVYLTLLRTGPNTIMNLARETGIKRSTTHNNVEELVNKGLVSQTNYGERRMVVAEEPEKLKFLIEQKKWTMNKIENNLESVISMIRDIIPNNLDKNKVEVKYYEGKKNIQSIYNEVLSSNNIKAFVNADIARIFPDNPQLFIDAQNNRKGMVLEEIIDNSAILENYVSKMDKKRYKYKKAPESLVVPDYLMYDGKVAIIDVNEKESDKVTAILVESENFYQSMVKLFGFVWQSIN